MHSRYRSTYHLYRPQICIHVYIYICKCICICVWVYLWIYIYMLLMLMFWHMQVIFEWEGDKLSSAECRIPTQGLWNRNPSRLDAHSQTDLAIKDQAKNLPIWHSTISWINQRWTHQLEFNNSAMFLIHLIRLFLYNIMNLMIIDTESVFHLAFSLRRNIAKY